MRRARVALLAGAAVVGFAGLPAAAQMGHQGPGGQDSAMAGAAHGDGGMGMGHGMGMRHGEAGMGGARPGAGGHGAKGAQPGSVVPVCEEPGGSPPHYCPPVFKVATSVATVEIAQAAVIGEKGLRVVLRERNPEQPGINRGVVLVGGGGLLAGAVAVEGNWKGTTTVHLPLEGNGTLFGLKSMRLHLFPYTGP